MWHKVGGAGLDFVCQLPWSSFIFSVFVACFWGATRSQLEELKALG